MHDRAQSHAYAFGYTGAMKRAEQGDYRIFVGAFPTGELIESIQALRSQHDAKTARITAPHVTLAGTYWRSGPPTPENEAATIRVLTALADKIEPFEVTLGGIEFFPPGHRIIYLAVQSGEKLLHARQSLLDALGHDKHRRFTPHLTLAMRLSEAASVALLAQLRQSEWHTVRWTVSIDRLWLMQRGPQDPAWRAIQAIELGAKP